MKRIGLFLDIHPHGGGAYQYTLSILEAVSSLRRDMYDVNVVYTNAGWEEKLDSTQLKSFYFKKYRVLTLFEYIWRKSGLPASWLRCLASRLNPLQKKMSGLNRELWIYPAQDAMSYMLDAPALATVHDLMHRYEPNFPEVSGYRLREYHYRALCKWSAGILVDSMVGKKQVVDSYSVDEKKVFPLPYVAPTYMYKAGTANIREKHNLPEKYFYYPAQLWTHKNHMALIHAICELKNELPDISIVLSGASKKGSNKLYHEAIKLGVSDRIHFLGYISDQDVVALYKSARALIMPTYFGPTNIPPLEAMVVGCPMALSNNYAMPEQCGDAALYFNPDSLKEITDVMRRLWVDEQLSDSLRKKGLERSKRYTQKVFNITLQEIIKKVFAYVYRD